MEWGEVDGQANKLVNAMFRSVKSSKIAGPFGLSAVIGSQC